MEILFLIGRIVVGIYYIFNGINHFRQQGMMVQYTQSQGVPNAGLAVPVTGLMLLLGGLSILLGAYPVVGIALLVIFLVPVAFMMHRFWGVDQQTAMMQMPHFLKNIALAGSALMFLAIPTPWSFSLGLG
ncbi:MAG: DoxX family membrane protein [Chloroflexi bacterium]|nr:DoxX family membrane protein [Chloroflexota bacterium]